MREGRKKEASKVKQTTRQSNTAHPRQSLFLRKMSCLSNPYVDCIVFPFMVIGSIQHDYSPHIYSLCGYISLSHQIMCYQMASHQLF